jgi:hypothetical protein
MPQQKPIIPKPIESSLVEVFVPELQPQAPRSPFFSVKLKESVHPAVFPAPSTASTRQ